MWQCCIPLNGVEKAYFGCLLAGAEFASPLLHMEHVGTGLQARGYAWVEVSSPDFDVQLSLLENEFDSFFSRPLDEKERLRCPTRSEHGYATRLQTWGKKWVARAKGHPGQHSDS